MAHEYLKRWGLMDDDIIGVYERTVQVILQEGVVKVVPCLKGGKNWKENPAGQRREEGGERSESGSEEEDVEMMSWSGGEEWGS